jgi:CheY-like chemotaxis protein
MINETTINKTTIDEMTRPKHVLVVEDEPDFAALLRSILSTAGYTVATTYFCDQALELARELRPDIITLDIQMPGKSGAYFYRKLKADEALREIPVIVVTGVTRDDRDMKTLVESLLETDDVPHPQAYLEKPVDGPSLVKAIEEALSAGNPAGC